MDDGDEDGLILDYGDEDGLISMMMVVILLVMMAIMKALSLLKYSNNFYSKRGKRQWSQSKCFVVNATNSKQIAVKQLMYSNWKITDHEGI